jgi:hypothetical protein
VLRDDLEPVPLGDIQLLDHGLVHRIADQAQVPVGTARKQIDVDQWHGPVSLLDELTPPEPSYLLTTGGTQWAR